MGGRALTTRLVAVVLVVAAWGCTSGGDGDTLSALPIEGGTVGTVAGTDAIPPTPAGTTTPPGPSTAPSPSVDPTASTVPAAPTGDWDGAHFDVGTIESVATLGAYSSIELDRWTYTRPDGSTVDAGGLDAEPVVAWWRTNPFSNVRVQTRTFVLDPDVEVLTLDAGGRRAACGDPPPTDPPAPTWTTSGTSALGSTSAGDMAVLTYSEVGLVTRVRLTRGC